MTDRIIRLVESKWYYCDGSASDVVDRQVIVDDLRPLEQPDDGTSANDNIPVRAEVKIAVSANLYQIKIEGLTLAEARRFDEDMLTSRWATATADNDGNLRSIAVEGQIYSLTNCEPIARP